MSIQESLLSSLPYNWKILFGVLIAIFSFLATIENGIVLVTIFNYQILRTTSNKILSSLAMSDFLTGASVGSLYAIQLLIPRYVNSVAIDSLRRYLSTFLVGASFFNLGFISYDRSVHLRLLNNYRLSQRKLYITLFVCWLIPLLVPLLRLVDSSEAAYSAVIAFFITMIFVGMICCYGLIIHALQKHQNTTSFDCTSQRQAVKTVCLILTFFAIAIIPICIYHVLKITKALPKEELAKSYIIGMLLCVMNSAINPIIYYLRTPMLKKHMHRLITALFWKRRLRIRPLETNHQDNQADKVVVIGN